jgi:hypothetical protein
MYPITLCECTVVPDSNHYSIYNLTTSPTCEIRNSMIFGKWQVQKTDTIATNTFFAVKGNGQTHEKAVGPGSRIVSAEKLMIDDDYRPVIGANAGIGAGDPMLLDEEDLSSDFSGGQRLYNGTQLDVGALAADWLGRYAGDISGESRFKVTQVSPAAVELEGVVRLPEGAKLDACWTNAGQGSRNYAVMVRVAADSILVVKHNGNDFAVYDKPGAYKFNFTNSLPANALSFACTAGSVEILSANQYKGMAISIR